jgi:hypothetical protein
MLRYEDHGQPLVKDRALSAKRQGARNGSPSAKDNNNNGVIAHVYPLNWPPELSEWSLSVSGPLKPSVPTFYREFVGGRVVTVPIKEAGLFKSYGGTNKYGADQGTATITGSWNWTINVQ